MQPGNHSLQWKWSATWKVSTSIASFLQLSQSAENSEFLLWESRLVHSRVRVSDVSESRLGESDTAGIDGNGEVTTLLPINPHAPTLLR